MTTRAPLTPAAAPGPPRGEEAEPVSETDDQPPGPAAPCRHEAVTYVVRTGRLTCNHCGKEL